MAKWALLDSECCNHCNALIVRCFSIKMARWLELWNKSEALNQEVFLCFPGRNQFVPNVFTCATDACAAVDEYWI